MLENNLYIGAKYNYVVHNLQQKYSDVLSAISLKHFKI
jgi:hypothetical protein